MHQDHRGFSPLRALTQRDLVQEGLRGQTTDLQEHVEHVEVTSAHGPLQLLVVARELVDDVSERLALKQLTGLCADHNVARAGVDKERLKGRLVLQVGDVLALLGAVLAAAYFTVSAEARKTVSTATLTFGLYGTAALLLLFLCVLLRQPLIGFTAEAWILILMLTLTAQLLGHSLINKVLATTSATVVSLAILFELPASTIIAAVALGQVPPWGIIPAAALIVTGLVIVIRASDSSELTEAPPV